MRFHQVVLATALMLAAYAGAQQFNVPHAGYVYPAGARQGSTVQVTVGGQFLEGANEILISGRGIAARVVGYNKPLTQREINDLRERAQELQKKLPDVSARAELQTIQQQVGESLRRLAAPVLSELLTLELTVAADAEPGTRSLRVASPAGISAPLVFVVGQLPEFRERDTKNNKTDRELAISLPAVVNGRIVPGDGDRARLPLRQPSQYMPGDADRYRFAARKGQHLVVQVSARDLMPYLADAVPGWFQATVALYDSTGREVAYADDYRFHPDPVLHYAVPADGEYVVEIRDALYRGREDFVYRIAIGELPFITSLFPLGGRADSRAKVALTGWNLPEKIVTLPAVKTAGIRPLAVTAGDARSNVVPFQAGDLPESIEREPNDSISRAQRVRLPAVVNGRIDRPGDVDLFEIDGRAGDRIAAQVFARRLESPLDSFLELADAAGRRIAFNDDFEDKAAWWITHQADSMFVATLPVRGRYFVRIGDVQHKGGPEYAYRLRVGPPRPDFQLRVTPSAITSAGTVPVTVHAVREEGFAGDITLKLGNSPDGAILSGGGIPAGQDEVRVTLTVPGRPPGTRVALAIDGQATIDGRTVTHAALPADDRMQAFAYHHLAVSVDDAMLLVTPRGAPRPAKVLGPQPLRLSAGGSADLRVALGPIFRTFEHLDVALSEPPDGIAVGGISLDETGATLQLKADADKVKPGRRGNLILIVSGERVSPGPPQVRRRVPVATLPAIPFEITAAR